MKMTRVLLLASLSVLLGCKAETAPNEIVVIVDSDMRVGSDLKSLDVEISGSSLDAGVLSSNHFELVADGTNAAVGQFTLPLSFVIAPTSQQSTRDFRLAVSGRDLGGVEVVVERQLISSFRPDYSGRLVVFLAQRCVQQLCRLDNGQRGAETCNPATGLCGDTPTVVPDRASTGDELAGYTRQDAGSAADAAQTHDAGTNEDASTPDAAQPADGAVPGNDAGVPDASMPPTQNVDPNLRMIAPLGLQAHAAASPTGRGVVVYQAPVAGSDPVNPLYEVWATLFEPGTGPDSGWRPPFLLSSMRQSDQSDSAPRAVFDAQGNLTVIWCGRYTLSARRNLAGKLGWEPELFISSGNVDGLADLIVDPAGNVMVAFGVFGGNANTARWEVIPGKWNTFYGNITRDVPGGPLPRMASDAAGNITAVWATNVGTVAANRFEVSSSSAGWGQVPVTLRTRTPTGGFSIDNVRLAVRGDGVALAMWSENEFGGSASVYANWWNPTLRAWGATTLDSGNLRVGSNWLHAVTVDPAPNGSFSAFWDSHIHTSSGSAPVDFSAALPVGQDGSVNMTTPFATAMAVDARGARVAAWPQVVPGGIDIAWSWAARPTTGPEAWAELKAVGGGLPPDSNNTIYNIGYHTLSIGSPGTALIAWNQPLSNDAEPKTAVYARWVTF